MKRFYNEELLGNKIVALAIVIVMLVTLWIALPLVPIVWFLGLPMALILTFTDEDFTH